MSAYIDVFNFIPPALLAFVHWLCGFIVLAEGLNKLERTAAFARRIGWRVRIATWLKIVAWFLLAVGAAGALVTPLLHLERPTLQDAAVMAGFALLIVRSRLKEVPHAPVEV